MPKFDNGSPSLRERKREETRRRLTETGLKLFLARGYAETTLDVIAEAAGVSRRTIFHYFSQKEDILLDWYANLGESLREAIAASPADRPPLHVVLRAALRLNELYQDEELIRIERLMSSVETLRARKAAKFSQLEQSISSALQTLWPDPVRRERLRLVSVVAAGALRVAFERWAERGGAEPLANHLRRAFADLRAEVGENA